MLNPLSGCDRRVSRTVRELPPNNKRNDGVMCPGKSRSSSVVRIQDATGRNSSHCSNEDLHGSRGVFWSYESARSTTSCPRSCWRGRACVRVPFIH